MVSPKPEARGRMTIFYPQSSLSGNNASSCGAIELRSYG
jgi:hypothetical protein